jgi:hypothetical protein
MRYFHIYTFILIISCALFIISCNKKKESVEEKKEKFEDAFNTVEELQDKAAQDTNFANSKEYKLNLERAMFEMSRKTAKMSENEKLLLGYRVSLKALKEYTDDLKQNPALARDASYMEKVQARAAKVREYYVSLEKVKMNPHELEEFNQLSHQ